MTKAEQSMTTGAEERAMTDSAQQVRVEQVDRERRKALFREAGLRLSGDHMDMAMEAADEAFARHRLAALASVAQPGVVACPICNGAGSFPSPLFPEKQARIRAALAENTGGCS